MDRKVSKDFIDLKPPEVTREFDTVIKPEDVSFFLPQENLTEGDEQNVVVDKIFDHSVNNFFKSDFVQKSSLGKSAKKIEKSMQADVVIKKKNPEDIAHKISMQFQPMQNAALIKYSGYIDARVNFFVASNNYEANISHHFEETELIVAHERSTLETGGYDYKSTIDLKWDW
ncbi:MAG: hypothetical protein AB8E15_09595 [Bdellovibrionales bacterium]